MPQYDPYDSYSVRDVSGGGSTGMNRNTKIMLAGGGVGLVVVWYYLQKRKAAAAAPAADASTDGSNQMTDPGYTPALDSYTDPSTGAIISGGQWSSGGYPLPGTTITTPATNAQWAQQAIAYLAQEGFDPVTASVAIGKYLAGSTLSASDLTYVQAALAVEGNPPNPPVTSTVPSGGQTGSGGGVTGGTNAPPVAPANLHIANQHKGVASLLWSPSKGATMYKVYFNSGHGYSVVGMTPLDHATVHRNGNYAVTAVRGKNESAHSFITVKGI